MGFGGRAGPHWLIELEAAIASLGGRMAARAAASVTERAAEEGVAVWLKSPLFAGGLEAGQASAVEGASTAFNWEEGATARAWILAPEASPAPLMRSSASTPGDGVGTTAMLSIAAHIAAEDAAPAAVLDAGAATAVLARAPEDAVKYGDEGARLAFLDAVFHNEAFDERDVFQGLDAPTTPAKPSGGEEAVGVAGRGSARPAVGQALVGWLQRTLPEARLARAQATFPAAEYALLAALLKHCGLWQEASAAVASLAGDVSPARKGAGRGGARASSVVTRVAPCAASAEMAEVWKSVRELRAFLRRQRVIERSGGFGADRVGETPAKERLEVAIADAALADVPRSVTQLCDQIVARCQLVLCLVVSNKAKERSQLANKWMDTLPPHALAPLLVRWTSTGAARTPDSPTPCSTLGSVVRACFLYATRGPLPRVLLPVMRRRSIRAACRAFGFKAFLSLVKSSSFDDARRETLLHMRPSLRGRVDLSAGPSGLAAAPETAKIRHHYMKALESAGGKSQDMVQACFIELFVYLGNLLRECLKSRRDLPLAHLVAWTWAIDFEPADREFLLRVGILPTLHAAFSLRVQAEQASVLARTTSTPRASWKLWDVATVQRAVHSGTLTKWELIAHLKNAPAGAVGQSWARRHGNFLSETVPDLAHRYNATDVLCAYEEFAEALPVTFLTGDDSRSDSETAGAARIIQSSLRAYLQRSVFERQSSSEAPAPPMPQFRGRLGAEDRFLRLIAYSLFKFITVIAVGGRRGIRQLDHAGGDPLLPADLAVAEVPGGDDADTAPGSAGAMLAAAAAAAAEMKALVGSNAVVGDPHTRRYAEAFAGDACRVVREELEASTAILWRELDPVAAAWAPGPQLAPPSYMAAVSGVSERELEAQEVELVACGLISFVCALRDSPTMRESWIASERVGLPLAALMRLAFRSSLRVQRMTCRVLGEILPGVGVDVADEACGSHDGEWVCGFPVATMAQRAMMLCRWVYQANAPLD